MGLKERMWRRVLGAIFFSGKAMSFANLGLSDALLKAVEDSGYTEPTPIQRQAIPAVLMGRDILGIAQTGTGKTASFTLPMLDILGEGRARARMARCLILEPTRELAAQVAESFDRYGKYHKLSKTLLIGGVAFGDQDKALEKGVDVLIATPGRFIDQFERGKILLSGVEVLIIDEADRMLDMGFIPDVERICSMLPAKRQTLFFSATMPPPVKKLADKFLNNPKSIEVARQATAAESIQQYVIETAPRGKGEVLRKLLSDPAVQTAIIFCNRKRDVKLVCESLKRHKFDVAQLHGDMEQSDRGKVLDAFRAGKCRILVASDVAARGLDVPAVSHVFNYDVPIHAEDYIHRIGRTGRASFTFMDKHEQEALGFIEKLIARSIERYGMSDAKAAGPVAEAQTIEAETFTPQAQSEEPRPKSRRARPAKKSTKPEDAKPAEAAVPTVPAPEAKPLPAPVHAKAQAPARTSSQSQNQRRGGRYQDNDSDDTPVVGMGAHVPSFLRHSARG
jgi:superfamily II DNA/RNA helicase